KFTILCIGDSHTFGKGTTNGNNYPKQLEKLLNSKTNNKFNVINRAVPGQNSTQVLQNIRTQINVLHPDLIIILIGGGNLTNQYGFGSQINDFLYKFKVYKMFEIILNNINKTAINTDAEKKIWEKEVYDTYKGSILERQRKEIKNSEEYKNALNI
ncbi:MAG TPA: SGNH/GDSL hydrolase family protein, partial [Candidatus Paceibacterota bacterium]|nr:SGNH/GDSL hydrolase family protein [Candidatus Paceibacterota bacterium]